MALIKLKSIAEVVLFTNHMDSRVGVLRIGVSPEFVLSLIILQSTVFDFRGRTNFA